MTISRELIATLTDASASNLKITRVLSQLEKIVWASGALLQAINKSFLNNSTVDYRSKQWLKGEESKACLETLQQMVKMTRVDMAQDTPITSDCFDEPRSASSEDKINYVLTLFNEQHSHFHFLLAADVE